jgi:hypothetical protein
VQFHQKLCAILDTTPQELGLEVKTVEKEQKNFSIRQYNVPSTAPATSSVNIHYFQLCIDRFREFLRVVRDATSNDRDLFIPHIQFFGKTGGGKSSAIHSPLFDTSKKQKYYYTSPMVRLAHDLMVSALQFSKDTSLSENIRNIAFYESFKKKVISLIHTDKIVYNSYIVQNLYVIYQYAFASNFYGVILPIIFVTHPQIDIGGAVSSVKNVILVIHNALSDPAWQGFGVVISIVLPFIIGYKKKSSPVDLFFPSIALAA